VLRRALSIYVSDLRQEITKTAKHEWLEVLRQRNEHHVPGILSILQCDVR
jgi:hypothetical protein